MTPGMVREVARLIEGLGLGTRAGLLSLYLHRRPIVVFLTGGAWIIGHRMWGALLGRAIVPFGVLVVVPDYGNFPSADVGDMVDDVDACLRWVFKRAYEYDGDADRVVLIGQSAGAHVGAVAVARRALDCLRGVRRAEDGGGAVRDGLDDARVAERNSMVGRTPRIIKLLVIKCSFINNLPFPSFVVINYKIIFS